MLDLSIIIVTYNAKDFLGKCLRSVIDQTAGISYEIIIVDNASTDGTKEMMSTGFPEIKFIRNEYNVGFAAANNQAIRETNSRFVLLLNPDTEILDGAIQKTMQFMEGHPRSGIASCKLFYQDGRFQANAYSFPTVWNMFAEATFLYKIFPKTKLFGSYHLTYLDYSKENQVDWLIGAFFLIRREVIEKIGLLDEQYFMYTEDLDYCYMAKQEGFEIWYTPVAQIFHFYGGISGINKRVAVWTHRSQILFYQKHFSFFKRTMLLLMKYFGLLLRIVRYFIFGILFMDKNSMKKAWYSLYSIYRMVVSGWKYIPRYSGKTTHWEI